MHCYMQRKTKFPDAIRLILVYYKSSYPKLSGSQSMTTEKESNLHVSKQIRNRISLGAKKFH